jgi:hypothetical protein
VRIGTSITDHRVRALMWLKALPFIKKRADTGLSGKRTPNRPCFAADETG